MGCFTGRCLLVTICVLQFIATVERQVFDFLGYMWAPIIGNFLHIIVIIIGFFGALQYRPRVVMVYAFCSLLWLGWNVFVICIYLEVGILSRDGPILSIGSKNKSWWLDNGIGCTITNSSWEAETDPLETSRKIPPEEFVEGCLLQYYYVEIIHAGVQCILSLLGFCVACYVIYVFTEEDDSSQPVHDELEYIKMRYKSPARSSFRDNKMYATLTTQSTAYSTMSRGVDAPNYSDDSADRVLHREQQQQGGGGSPHQQHRQHGSHPHLGQSGGLQVPWQGNTPVQQTDIPAGMTELPEGQTELPVTPTSGQHGGYPPHYQHPAYIQGGQVAPSGQYGIDPKEQQPQYRYNITGQTQGVTVI